MVMVKWVLCRFYTWVIFSGEKWVNGQFDGSVD